MVGADLDSVGRLPDLEGRKWRHGGEDESTQGHSVTQWWGEDEDQLWRLPSQCSFQRNLNTCQEVACLALPKGSMVSLQAVEFRGAWKRECWMSRKMRTWTWLLELATEDHIGGIKSTFWCWFEKIRSISRKLHRLLRGLFEKVFQADDAILCNV